MNIIELNADALLATCLALLGQEKTAILNEMYTLVDNAERRGRVEGYAEGHAAGFDRWEAAYEEGQERGFKDGFAQRALNQKWAEEEEAYQKGRSDEYARQQQFVEGAFSDGASKGYDEGYAQAREDLGECPMVEPEWDLTNDGYLVRAVSALEANNV